MYYLSPLVFSQTANLPHNFKKRKLGLSFFIIGGKQFLQELFFQRGKILVGNFYVVSVSAKPSLIQAVFRCSASYVSAAFFQQLL